MSSLAEAANAAKDQFSRGSTPDEVVRQLMERGWERQDAIEVVERLEIARLTQATVSSDEALRATYRQRILAGIVLCAVGIVLSITFGGSFGVVFLGAILIGLFQIVQGAVGLRGAK